MAKRGKVLRDPNAGPGLMIVEGQQHPFFLEGFWQSEVPPKPGLAVEVDFDSQGKVSRITVVPEAQLAKEQAEMAPAAAKKRGIALASTMVGRFDCSDIVCTPVPGIWKVIVSAAPAFVLASTIACRSDPGPLSFVFVTTSVTAPAAIVV